MEDPRISSISSNPSMFCPSFKKNVIRVFLSNGTSSLILNPPNPGNNTEAVADPFNAGTELKHPEVLKHAPLTSTSSGGKDQFC